MRCIATAFLVVLVTSGGMAAQESRPAATMSLDLGGGMKMVLLEIPPGEFMMGSPDGEKERQACETPVHRVRITRPFHMGRCEVTNRQYRCFRPEHRSGHLDGDNQPALWVSWHDAEGFCRWLSREVKKNVRLPTEAQWEYACRAGTSTRFHTGDGVRGVKDSADLALAAWYGATAAGRSHPVGLREPNKFGLYDMHGNAWEWCRDWFAADYYRSSPAEDPTGPAAGAAKVLRGGCWFYWTHHYCRSGHRYRFRPDAREPVIGFRVVLEPGPYQPPSPPEVTQPWPPARDIVLAWAPANKAEAEVTRSFGPPAVFVPRTEAPEIDGKLDDAVWKKARPLYFRHLSGRPAPPSQTTIARVLSDEGSLYFAFACGEDDMKRLTAAGTNRDDPIWQGDTVEIFLDPHHQQRHMKYYHIAVNPAGLTMDSKDEDPLWTPQLKVATQKMEAGWTVELALPLASLELSDDDVPTVWGMNLTRYRPDFETQRPRLGTLTPHSWPVDNPDLLRLAEDTGWAATLSDSSHVAARFGHAVLEIGRKKTAPPARLFELIARADFASGSKGRFSDGAVEDGGYMGAGKALRVKGGQVTVFQVPLTDFRDVQLLATLKAEGGSGVYWHTFGKMYGSSKCCPRQVTTLTHDPLQLPPTFNYCDGAGRIDATSAGVADPYYAAFMKHLSWFSEPTIGRIRCAGPDHWAVVYTRVGDLQTQHPHNRRVEPEKDAIPGWFFHSAGDYDLLISDAVMFKGIDNEPPEKPAGVRCRADGEQVMLAWNPSRDNTLTVWYRILLGEGEQARPIAETARLSMALPRAAVGGRKLCVQAVDFFENVSEPSRPVNAR